MLMYDAAETQGELCARHPGRTTTSSCYNNRRSLLSLWSLLGLRFRLGEASHMGAVAVHGERCVVGHGAVRF